MRSLIIFLSTGCYTGYVPRAPGTAGSVIGMGLVWALASLPLFYYLLITLALFVIGVWASSRAETYFGHDGQPIVIDEIVGVMVVFAGVSLDPFTVVTGFILFRVIDILKPFPCNCAQRFAGGMGVMLDDAAAALYALVLLRLTLWVIA